MRKFPSCELHMPMGDTLMRMWRRPNVAVMEIVDMDNKVKGWPVMIRQNVACAAFQEEVACLCVFGCVELQRGHKRAH